MSKSAEVAKKFINKIKDIYKSIMKIIKFLSTTIGQVIAILLLVVFVVLLFQIIGDVFVGSLEVLVGYNWNYDTYTEDKQYLLDYMSETESGEKEDSVKRTGGLSGGITSVVKEINDSGYGSMINATNYQNFKAFEYAVLMDAAEYIRTNKQEMFDITANEGDYAYERSLLASRKPEMYRDLIEAYSKKYANIGGRTGESSSVSLLNTSYTTTQSLVDKDKLEVLNSQVSEDAKDNEILNVGTVRGGNNRVKGPYITYEFKGYNGGKSSKNNTPSTMSVNFNESQYHVQVDTTDYSTTYGDETTETISGAGYDTIDTARLSKSAKAMYEKYGTYIKQYAKEYGIDPYLIIAVIMKESGGQTVSYQQPPTSVMGLMGVPINKTFEVSTVKNTKKTIDTSFGKLNNLGSKQIEAGVAYLRAKIYSKKWNIYNGILAYKGSEGASYFSGLMTYYYGDGNPWIIGTDSYKYYTSKASPYSIANKVYADVETGKDKVTTQSTTTSSGVVASGYITVDTSKLSNDTKVAWKKYSSEIKYAAEKYGIDPMIIMAMIMQESSGVINTKTPTKEAATPYAYGLMQIMSDFGKSKRNFKDVLGNTVVLNCTEAALKNNARAQIEAGTAVLREKLENNNWNIKDGINAYLGSKNNFPRIKNRLGKQCTEIWIIIKQNNKYYKKFLNVNTLAVRQVEINIKTGADIAGTEQTYDSPEELDTFDDATTVDLSTVGTTTGTTGSNQEIITGSTVEKTTPTKTSGTDTLEPYIYVVKEDINFSYYFDENNSVIQYPLILNANNAKLNVGKENGEEIKRALLGISPVVWPDDDSSAYTLTPYYSDVTTPTVYKIPLRTILGRYLPKQELLLTWSMLKQNVDKGTTGVSEKDFMDYAIESIKGIYNEACLETEETTPITTTRAIKDEKGNDGTEAVNYTNEDTHKKTFVTFSKVGLETTKYDIEGLQPITDEDSSSTVKVVTDFINAVIIQTEFTADISYTYVDMSKPVGVDTSNAANGIGGAPTLYETKTVSESRSYSLSSLGNFGGTYGEIVIATGDPINGYTPPSSVDGEYVCYIPGATEYDVSSIRSKIKSAIEKTITGSNVSVSLPSDVVRYNPVFIISDPIYVQNKLKIVHTRMPALLVDSAKTWCREVTYSHNIVQNQFKQNKASYIVPNSKSGTGITVFETKAVENGYRGKAYSEIFAKLQEKDLVNMLLQFESIGKQGFSDAYEYMRDLYRLAKVSQAYSTSNSFPVGDSHYIHPDTYSYVYVPESITKYNDLESQKIYWLNLLTATADDPIRDEELKNFRARNKPLSWQMVEYDKYEECNTYGVTKVYALSPFASPYLRTYYEMMYQHGLKVDGCFKVQNHSGADWAGRKKINDILVSGKTATTNERFGKQIYDYEYSRLNKVIGASAETQLENVLKEQTVDNPIIAVAPGVVEKVAYSARAGFYVRILHSEYNGAYSYYVHLKRWPEVSVGDYVGAGTLIGYEGDTGRSFGSHLHFQLKVGGDIVSPAEYVFPTFNPFYYEEKAAEVGYALEKEYMSLERTVRMVSELDPKIENRVPATELVDDYSYLILNQGAIQRPERYSGTLDWSTNYDGDSVEEFVKYLSINNYYDLYLEDIFFDREKAYENGLLDADPELFNILFGNIIVKTDLAGALPALTETELRTILNTWLPTRYNNEEKVQWLMDYVFTDDNIRAMIAYQNEYKVSIIFALAVATQEQQLGLSETTLALEPACNLFSIRHSSSSGYEYIEYQDGKHWNKYGSYINAFEDFMKLIAERGPYFKSGRYTIGTIATKYCEGNTWGTSVSNIVMEIMKYYNGNDWSMPAGTVRWAGNNTNLVNAAKNCFAWLSKWKFSYCQSGCSVSPPPYEGPSTGDFSNAKPRGKATKCGHSSTGKPNTYKVDCSKYVTWVLYEYGIACGDTTFAELIKKCDQSGWYRDIGHYLYDGNPDKSDNVDHDFNHTKEVAKYFQLVWHAGRDKYSDIKDIIMPGDVIAYYKPGQGHVEIWVGAENDTEAYHGTFSISNQTHKNIYSCGLYKSDTVQKHVKCIIRPMPLAGSTDAVSNDTVYTYQGNDGRNINAGNEKSDSGTTTYYGTAKAGEISFESESGLPQLEIDISNIGGDKVKKSIKQRTIWTQQQDRLCFMAMKYGVSPTWIAIQIANEGNDWRERNSDWGSSVGPFSTKPAYLKATVNCKDIYGNTFKVKFPTTNKAKNKNAVIGRLLTGDDNNGNPRINVQMEIGTSKWRIFIKNGNYNVLDACCRHASGHGPGSEDYKKAYKRKTSTDDKRYKKLMGAYKSTVVSFVVYRGGKFYKISSDYHTGKYVGSKSGTEVDYTLVIKNKGVTTKYKYTSDKAFYKWVVGEDYITKYQYEESPIFSVDYVKRDLPKIETKLKIDGSDSGDQSANPNDGQNNTNSNTQNNGTVTNSSKTAGEAFLEICSKMARYIAKNNFKYGVGGFPKRHYTGAAGTFSGKPRYGYVDCIGLVRWAVYEYAYANQLTSSRGRLDLKDNINCRKKNCSFSTFTQAAIGKGYLSEWFEPVYYNGGKYASPKQLKALLKPGDILVWDIKDKVICKRTGRPYDANHMDIFAKWERGKMLGYDSGQVSLTNSHYRKGQPASFPYSYISAVIRWKPNTLKNAELIGSGDGSSGQASNPYAIEDELYDVDKKQPEEVNTNPVDYGTTPSDYLQNDLIGTYEPKMQKYENYKLKDGSTMSFWLYTPSTITTNMPIIVFWHGSGEVDKSLDTILKNCKNLKNLAENKTSVNAILIAPVLHSDKSKSINEVVSLLSEFTGGGFKDVDGRTLTADPNKTVSIAFSLGNEYVVQGFSNKRTDTFKVDVFISSFTSKNAKYFKNAKKVFVYYGKSDTQRCRQASQSLADNIKQSGGNIVTRVLECGHSSMLGKMFSDNNLYEEILAVFNTDNGEKLEGNLPVTPTVFDQRNAVVRKYLDGGGSISTKPGYDKPAKYNTKLTGNIKVYSYNSSANTRKFIATVTASTLQYYLIPGQTYYLESASDKTKVECVKVTGSLRMINVPGAANVRDLGGWEVDGGTIKYGRIYRGALPHKKSKNVLANYLKISTIVNLRDHYSLSPLKVVNCTMNASTDAYFTKNNKKARPGVTQVMKAVVNGENVYFHCNIGTDRTGTVAFLIEGILGMPYGSRIKDFKLSALSSDNIKIKNRVAKLKGSLQKGINKYSTTNKEQERFINWYLSTGKNKASDLSLINAFRRQMIDGKPTMYTLGSNGKVREV